ncbi:cytochrome c biogenesis protein transmembrane region [Denitrovibrio acetiphilus DSM 12809]|uniref:Cytochrome c biogenesis protein transmembrane region n=1 Tax=Denitrovibrio acetiphilus (strain DSM 12809 / NBRC 114555 / N2460) TaxID=522772 RepID=D4H296_DENA2|nr:cytochrome c biogenesis protein CcdA [Denitrovibrio acetiphilus]ADD68887.1 cytochrome c biogenesis protein transmembrane region [Denitrovibrio acetiphilus DSM 12809]
MNIEAYLNYAASVILSNAGWAPLIAFAAGLATSFTPCSVGGIPLLIGYIGGTDVRNSSKAFKLSLLFAIGGAVVYTLLGFTVSFAGSFIALSKVWYIILGILMTMMALQIMDVFEFIPSGNFISRDIRKGYAGAIVAGALSGLFSSPCSTPVLVAILSIAAKSGNTAYGVLLLFSYSIGHSILLIACGTSASFANRILQQKRYHQATVVIKYMLAIVILAAGLYLFYLGF